MPEISTHSVVARVENYRARVGDALTRRIPSATTQPARLHEAMRYATLNGGKRVRAILVYATGEALGAVADALDPPACAVELIHAYSLVHDDLPAMDDDDLRRGRPSCHCAYDEATALLAGDALQALAFEVLARTTAVAAEQRIEMVNTLAHASGSCGMAGGQMFDLEAVGKSLNLTELEFMHIHKTGALIRASVRLGALARAGVEQATLTALDRYAECIGLAFQIRDDVLDVEGDTEVLGKQQGADQALDKPTYTSAMGVSGAKRRAAELGEEAIARLDGLEIQAPALRWLADFIVTRQS